MPKQSKFDGQLLHFGMARYCVNGSGTLRSKFLSFNETASFILPNITMSLTTDEEPLILGNFIKQKAFLKIETTAINETFDINKIIIFIKPVGTGYPQ